MPDFERKREYIISGSIDIQVEIEPVEFDDMANRAPAEPSSAIRGRVMAARDIQQVRFRDLPGIHCNAQMSGKQLRQFAWPDSAGLAKLKDRMTKLNMSARAFDRILRVARTIADLESAASLPARDNADYPAALAAATAAPVLSRHIAEAIGYRVLDRPSNFGVAF